MEWDYNGTQLIMGDESIEKHIEFQLWQHNWNACIGETLSWVRIPLSPPN